MTDINCPICNRMNNDEAERCWYCQAVLHPEREEQNSSGDWLDGFKNESNESSAVQNQAPGSAEPSEDVPDWLARIRQREQMEHETQPDQSRQDTGDGMDWLRSIADDSKEDASPVPEALEETTIPTPIDNDDSDWLGNLESWKSGNAETPEISPAQPQDDGSTPGVEESLPIQPAAPEMQDFDWLNEIKSGEVSPIPETPPQPDIEPEPAAPVKMPAKTISPEPVSEVLSPKAPASSEPDWLQDFTPLDPTRDLQSQVMPKNEPAAADKLPFSGRDMMNWISKDQQPTPVEEVKEESAPGEEGIEPAALPPWLQALRPNKLKRSTGSTKNGVTDESLQNPLAGIEGVLQGDALHQFYTRPQIYANTLKITPEQENHLLRLQKIAGEAHWETQETPARKESNGKLLRIITVLLMIGGVLFSTLTNKTPLAAPTLYPQAMVQVYDAVSAQTPDRPVLIAADFDGSLFGEVRWSSDAVLRQLISQDVPIAYLSTTQVGATLMRQTLADLTTNDASYVAGERTVNLGYLAGGTVGLQALAQNPRSALPLSTDLKSAWEDTPLESIEKIDDFGAVIVITENADTARYWVEQVKPSMGETPLLVVISAQSAPMLQPYYESGQVNGYVAGQSEAAAYEELAQMEGSALSHYSTLQVSLLVVAILIFISGLISLILRTPLAEKTSQEGK